MKRLRYEATALALAGIFGGTAFIAVAEPTIAAESVVVEEFIPVPAGPGEIDIMTVEPSEEHVWIPGYYERGNAKWDWIRGHWEKPPHQKAIWRPGHWQWETGKWRWNRGHWSAEEWGYFVDEVIEIPEHPREVKPEKPSKDAHWLNGYWQWAGGRWEWTSGRWDRTPENSRNLEWVSAHWSKTSHGKWRWIGGHYVERPKHG